MLKNITTLRQLMLNSIKLHANKNALSFVDDRPVSYQTFNDLVVKTQTLLQKYHIKPGDRVAILSHNMPNWGVAYFAITTMGAVAVPLLPDFSANEIDNILNHSESKAIFVSDRLKLKVDQCALASLQTMICIDSLSILSSTVDELQVPGYINNDILPDDLATIVYTSGTTGKSKGVMLTHSNLIAQIEMIDHIQDVNDSDVFLSMLPLSHMYECAIGLLIPIYKGASIYYLEKPPTASILLPAVQKIKPTYMLTVPMIVEKIYKSKILPTIQENFVTRWLYKLPVGRKAIHRKAAKTLYNMFGGRLKFFGIGGAKLDPVVEQFLYDGKAFPYAIGYGLTETSPLLSAATPAIVKPQSTGYALPGVELKIHNPNPKTGEGEIWAKGANIMKGYYKEPEMTDTVLTPDKWFKTGDLGIFDHSGRLYIKGRLKNVILGSSGENIYPEEIESLINNFKYVNDSLVLEQKGKLVAMVRFNYDELEKQYKTFKEELERKIDQLRQELLDYVNSRVNRFSQISTVVVLQDDFEKTSTQKIKRYLYATN